MAKPEPRRAVPMRVQRDCALALCADLMRKLGMIPVEVTPRFDLDHSPALALRAVDPETGEHIPHQHSPAHLVWMTKDAHTAKTYGTGATTRGADAGDIAHVRRLTAKQAQYRARVLARAAGDDPPPAKPKSRIARAPKRPAQPQLRASRPVPKTEILYRRPTP